jgi:hypothetical protein
VFDTIITGEAESEMLESALWYNDRSSGLGDEFLAEVNKVIFAIRNNPIQFRKVGISLHSAHLKRFPFSLFYYVLKDQIKVVGCLHDARDRDTILEERI